jgi:hypothetical protein
VPGFPQSDLDAKWNIDLWNGRQAQTLRRHSQDQSQILFHVHQAKDSSLKQQAETLDFEMFWFS